MAKKLDTMYQRKHNQRIFPKSRRETKIEYKSHTKLTVILTGQGKTKAYLHRFKVIKGPTFYCGTAEKITDNVICECEMLKQIE